MTDTQNVQIAEAKGRPMLHWVGKRPLDHVTAYPAQLVERFDPLGEQTSGSWRLQSPLPRRQQGRTRLALDPRLPRQGKSDLHRSAL